MKRQNYKITPCGNCRSRLPENAGEGNLVKQRLQTMVVLALPLGIKSWYGTRKSVTIITM